MDTATTPRGARAALVLLILIAGALVAGAVIQRDRALEEAYADAERRAELYAATVLRGSLSTADMAAPLEDDRRRALIAEVQPFVLTDPAVARVKLWGRDGTLLFSTDLADRPGRVSRDPAIDAAISGATESRVAVEDVSRSTVEADPVPTSLFQTFTPVQLRGAVEPSGVAEIEQFASELEERAVDPWWIGQLAASGAAVLVALLAFAALTRRGHRTVKERPSRRRRRGALDGDASDLRERLEHASARAKEAEGSAAAYAAQLQQVTARLESLEQRSPDERMRELREALRRSEAERAMLRAGRPETVLEAEVRQLRTALQDARSRAKAAEAVVAGKGDLSAVQEQLSTAERETERALERARVAEGRADAAEDQALLTGELAAAAEQRIDLLEAKLQEVAGAGIVLAESGDVASLREQLAAASERASELERRAAEAEATLSAAAEARSDEMLLALEQRIAAAEARAAEAEERVRAFEEPSIEESSAFRHTLGVRAAGRKLAAPPPAERQVEPEDALRSAISRGLRGPLTRASGLTLSLQGSVATNEGRNLVRQLSSTLRRMDQLTADLQQVRKILDGSLALNRRRTDVTALLTATLEEADHLHEDRLLRLDAERVQATVDPIRLRQIVEGMLEAARERTRAGAAILVRARNTGAGVRISVEDDNKIPASVGPEMSLAARLAELHGTELVADGSSFRVLLPTDEDG